MNAFVTSRFTTATLLGFEAALWLLASVAGALLVVHGAGTAPTATLLGQLAFWMGGPFFFFAATVGGVFLLVDRRSAPGTQRADWVAVSILVASTSLLAAAFVRVFTG